MRRSLAMNLLLWGTEMNASMFAVLDEIKAVGYDAVEIPIFDTDEKLWKCWKQQLNHSSLNAIAVTINGPDHHAISQDQGMRKKTLERNKRALDCAAILESSLLTGPFHSALGVFTGSTSTADEKKWAAEHLYQLSEYADTLNITLALEYLNRFESYLVSCADELIDLIHTVGHPQCKLMLDTFHANIEEQSIEAAIKKMGNQLVHVQLSENDRGTLGKGHIDFSSILSTLNEINYNGVLSIEAFSPKLRAANIWRPLFENEMQLTTDSFLYLHSL
ncbi:MAG: sugar phosphate isomerase/epimerase [Chitinophagaceae bacterium]|jgi:D-psicose/D-tagatose/L-ribulose 3-epimerase|nr:sugar phosphate isomerase/epimerase [Chitinophagaceae bacterium]